MKKNLSPILSGLIVSNLLGVFCVTLCRYLVNKKPEIGENLGLLIYSNFIIVPILMGVITAYYLRKTNLKNYQYFLVAIANTLVAVALSALFIGEGYLCLLIVSPLIIAFVTVGMFIGKKMFGKKDNRLNISFAAVLLFLFLVDGFSEHHFENCVSDTILIKAPPEKVWNYVVAYEPNPVNNEFWLFRIGMPSPVQSTVDGYKVGAGRKCIFSNGYTFDEKMTVYKPNQDLMFDIVRQPRDPEIMGHIDILKGQFLLHDNHDGTTTLTGNSWYRLHVFPAWYYDLWASTIVRQVHIRVMHYIKALSERGPSGNQPR